MQVYQITEFSPVTDTLGSATSSVIGKITGSDVRPGPGKFNYEAIPDSGGKYAIKGPDGNNIATASNKAKAVSGSINLNRQAWEVAKADGISFKDAVKTDKFKNRLDSSKLRGWGIASMKLDFDGDTPKPGKGVTGKVGAAAKGMGKKMLAVISNTLVGKVIFAIVAIEDIAADLDGWAQVYMDNGCNLDDPRLDAYEMKIRRTILENIAMFAAGAGLAAAGVIRTVSLFLMALPIAGWIATALAWVGAGVLASMVAKLLTNNSVAEYIADHMIGSMMGPATLKLVSFPQCPNESIRESWEAKVSEDIRIFTEKKQAQKKQAALGAAAAIKDVFKADPQLMGVLKATKQKVDSGEVEKISKGGKSAVKQALANESFREAVI